MEVGRLLLSRYELCRHLASGAMSNVWVARDQVTDQEVAIKAISLESAGWRAEVRDRFQKEAQLLALSSHENLVGVRGSGETDDGYLFLVLDLVAGETLADRLAREPRLAWQEAAALALGISRGVSALHAHGIVHRDLKPANIILEEREGRIVPKIIDLGISKVLDAAGDPALSATLTATGQVLGTPQYMSYEQALGERDVDARSDVWALGAVLYEMLAWRRPFHAPNINAVLAAIRRQDGPGLGEVAPELPAELVAIVDSCMKRARDERFQDAGELARQIESVLVRSAQGLTLRSTPPPPIRPRSGALPPAGTSAAEDASRLPDPDRPSTPLSGRLGSQIVLGGMILGVGILLGVLMRGAISPRGAPAPPAAAQSIDAAAVADQSVGPRPELQPVAGGDPRVDAGRAADAGALHEAAAAGEKDGNRPSGPALAPSTLPERKPAPAKARPGTRAAPVTHVDDSGL